MKSFLPLTGLPHLEINYSQLRDFSDVDLSIKPHKRVCKLQQSNPETVSIAF